MNTDSLEASTDSAEEAILIMARRDVLKLFGGRVREVRLQKGLSQEELARKAKIDRTYIGGIERGERNVGIRNVYRIATALEISAADLFYEGD